MVSKFVSKIKRYIAYYKSGAGSKDGWIVEYNGNKLGELYDVTWVEMFWVSYQFTLDDLSFQEQVKDWEFWARDEVTFFSRSMNEHLNHKSPIIQPCVVDDKVVTINARGLYM